MISFNTNSASNSASYNLNKSNANLQRSLTRLSSGFRINSSFDDAGGLAVSMKLSAAIRRTDAVATGVANGISYLETQDGVLKAAGDVLTRMSELATLAQDVTKSTDDLANYDLEFQSLVAQLQSFDTETFNGIDLVAGANLTVKTSEDGSQSHALAAINLNANVTGTISGNLLNTGAAATAAGAIEDAIIDLGTARADNGGDQSRLSFAADLLAVNKTNLEAANSRIIDVDVAHESTQLARWLILQQSGTAMLAQANSTKETLLRLLQ